MFSSRNTDRKPDTGLIKKFQANFSDILIPASQRELLNRPVNPKDLHSTAVTQATPEIRFTPFLDDQALPDSNAHDDYHRRLGLFNTGLHGQAGDLHTPSNLLTPETLLDQFKSVVTPLHKSNSSTHVDPFDQEYLATAAHDFSWGNPILPYHPGSSAQPGSVPSSFPGPNEEALYNDVNIKGQALPQQEISANNIPGVGGFGVGSNSSIRYKVFLDTPTAMIHNPNDTPITYLNKGQTYTLSIADSNPIVEHTGSRQYRTSIRISFDAIEHVSNSASCWGLWKARGQYNSQGKSCNPHAVELVDLNQKESEAQNFEVEKTSLDGFTIRWSANASGRPNCRLGIRFNLLSTDFSNSKGVKGSSLRLCAKTEIMGQDEAELSYCKVKVFRDHGAERKMFTDVSQLKRAIEKRKAAYLKDEAGDVLGKRKRDGRIVADTSIQYPGDERRGNLQRGLDAELTEMQKAFSSHRPVTQFSIPGDAKDDPDLFPIDSSEERKQFPYDKSQPALEDSSPSSTSDSRFKQRSVTNYPTPTSTAETATHRTPLSETSSPITSERMGAQRRGFAERSKSGENSQFPLASNKQFDTKETPAACFYIRFQEEGEKPDEYHTAIYLTQRTAQNLRTKISLKRNFGQDLEIDIFHVKESGMKIWIDDDVVRQIPDKQAISAEISRPLASDDNKEGEVLPGNHIEIKLYY